MEVILLERIEKLGQMGDLVSVKPGYARNFLLPRKKALRATDANRAVFEKQRSQLEADNLELRSDAERVAKDLDGMTVVVVRQASDSDQLYGSVTTRDISAAIVAAGVTVDRRQVQLDRPIKTVGMHPIRVILHPEVTAEVIANIARSEEEAGMQARGERLNRDGDIVAIDDDEIVAEAEAAFEEGAAPDADELSVADAATDVPSNERLANDAEDARDKEAKEAP